MLARACLLLVAAVSFVAASIPAHADPDQVFAESLRAGAGRPHMVEPVSSIFGANGHLLAGYAAGSGSDDSGIPVAAPSNAVGAIFYFTSITPGREHDIHMATCTVGADGSQVWSNARPLGAEVNSTGDDGVAAVSPDGRTVFFYSFRPGWELDGGPFYMATIDSTGWNNVRGMGSGISSFFRQQSAGASVKVYGASVTADGEEFYFATDAGNARGVHQIWVASQRNGQWGAPVRLGSEINSPNGSFAPFVSSDGSVLIFTNRSANGEEAMLISTRENGEWSPAVPLSSEQRAARHSSQGATYVSLATEGASSGSTEMATRVKSAERTFLPLSSRASLTLAF